MNNSALQCQNAIKNYVSARLKAVQKNSGAVQGVYSGGKVTINNQQYNVALTVDMPAKDGLNVWCVLNDTKDTAVIVGWWW